jgi:AraC family transcriptional regulator, transcriptional activator FtrA
MTADSRSRHPSPHRVAVLTYPGVALFELSVVIEVFGLARPELAVPWWYELDVCAIEPGRQPALGLSLDVAKGLDAFAAADTAILPCWRPERPVPPEVRDALLAVHARGGRLVSICSGAFCLAATGLLDGRSAATHWMHADALARAYPRVRVDHGVLYVDDDQVLTAAGSAAAIDMCLHLVRKDHGAAVANQVARRLVVPPHRDGGQAQFVESPVAADGDSRVHEAIAWAEGNLARPITVPDLARYAHLSERQFTRRFRQVTGASPMDWLTSRRVAASLALLEDGDDPIEHIASAVGFATAQTYRHHFRTRMKTTPNAYRRAFRR